MCIHLFGIVIISYEYSVVDCAHSNREVRLISFWQLKLVGLINKCMNTEGIRGKNNDNNLKLRIFV